MTLAETPLCAVAVSTVRPRLTAVTSPFALMEATFGFDEVKRQVVRAFASITGFKSIVSSTFSVLSPSSSTQPGAFQTSSEICANTSSALVSTRIVASPRATAVITPSAFTRATAGFDEVYRICE